MRGRKVDDWCSSGNGGNELAVVSEEMACDVSFFCAFYASLPFSPSLLAFGTYVALPAKYSTPCAYVGLPAKYDSPCLNVGLPPKESSPCLNVGLFAEEDSPCANVGLLAKYGSPCANVGSPAKYGTPCANVELPAKYVKLLPLSKVRLERTSVHQLKSVRLE